MDTTLLFDFSFVDRSNESKVFDSFINENKKNILWVDGNHGVGKTRFVKYNIQKYKQYKICYFNINNEITSEDFLKDFIESVIKKKYLQMAVCGIFLLSTTVEYFRIVLK